MTVSEAIRCRRSIRRFAARPVSDAVVLELIELVRHAPSSLDGQPWQLVAVRDADIKRELANAKNSFSAPDKRAYPADFLVAAPVVVAVCVDRERSHGRARECGVIAATYLLLAAVERGLASAYLTAYQSNGSDLAAAIARILGLPAEIEAVALLPLGYPAESGRPKVLRPPAEILHRDRFGGASEGAE